MLKDTKTYQKFEEDFIRRAKVDNARNFSILKVIYNKARIYGAIPFKGPLYVIEVAISIAEAINSVPGSSK